MRNFSFITLNVFRLSIDNVLGLIRSTLDLAQAVKSDLGSISNATLAQLKADNDKYEPMVNNPRKSALTEQVLVAGADRKERFTEIKRIVKLHLKGRDTGKKAAAGKLEFFFKPFWDTINEPKNTVTGVLSGMFGKYDSDTDTKAAAVTLAIDTLLTELKASNSAFDLIYTERLKEDAQRESSASDQKNAVCNSYNEFCTAIEQEINYKPVESVTHLFKSMDELRMTYQVLVPNGKGKPPKDQPSEPE